MATEVFIRTANGYKVIEAELPSFEEAKAWVRANYNVVDMEDDGDHPGCADAFASCGTVLCIQPVGFKL